MVKVPSINYSIKDNIQQHSGSKFAVPALESWMPPGCPPPAGGWVRGGGRAPPQKIFEFFYIKMACSGALQSMDFKLNHVPARSCVDNQVPVLNKADHFSVAGGVYAPIAPHPWLRACRGASNSLVDFIMHEYLHKYFENIKKNQKKFFSYVTRGP